MGMFSEYAVENDLAYIDDKVCNYYEIGNYKSDEEMAARDQEVAGGIEKPDPKRHRARGTAAPKGERKTRAQVEAENNEKIGEYMEQVDKAVSEAAGDRKEIPFEEAAAAADKVPKPDLEKPPRRTRRERQEEADQNKATEDMYFYHAESDSFWMVKKGEVIPGNIDAQCSVQITKEEYEAKHCNIPDGQDEDPLPMNPPVEGGRKPRERKARDIQPEGQAEPQETPQEAVQEPEQGGSARSRRTRRTRG